MLRATSLQGSVPISNSDGAGRDERPARPIPCAPECGRSGGSSLPRRNRILTSICKIRHDPLQIRVYLTACRGHIVRATPDKQCAPQTQANVADVGIAESMSEEKAIIVRRARYVPVLLGVAAVMLGIFVSPWWLLSIPFVAIGNVFTAPNLNLINGFPSYLSIVVGFILMRFHEPSGLAVVAGAAASFYGSALEMRIFAKPYHG